MRAHAPFGYESNALLLSQVLVPDPVRAPDWRRVMAEWEGRALGGSLLEALVRSGVIGERRLLAVLGEALGVAWLEQWEEDASDTSPEAQLLRRQGMLVLKPPPGRRLVAGGPEARPDLARLLGPAAEHWEWVLISPLREMEAEQAVGEDAPGAEGLRGWLEGLVRGLWSRGAADIHFERAGDALTVRVHEAGRMRAAGTWTGPRARDALRLLRTLAGLSTAEAPPPQDGRLRVGSGRGEIRFRLSHVATVDGESAVLRVLGTADEARRFTDLGLPDGLGPALVARVRRDAGLILCTGPTGSGKTTTLYGLMAELQGLRLKLLTIEDPVEHELPFAVQSAVDERAGWTFDEAVRCYLRQDPDVIMVGEMRDAASAEAACRAALTGHCVLSTLHARSAEAALDRMAAWGLPAGTLAETVRVVVNQRLAAGPDGALQASFTWIEPEPDELYAYLGGRAGPFTWRRCGPRPRTPGPSSTIPPP